jgi:cyclopropane fatty-acyl-phospholipid synthase-like methyltransferase
LTASSRTAFDIRYLLGKTPWDTQVTPPEVMELLEDETITRGRALDLGCGTGTNCIALAEYGWEAVGVDFSALAIKHARRQARRAAVDCQFYRADVTDLAFLVRPFDVILDIGCLHSLACEDRERYAAEVVRLIAARGLYMLYAFARTNRGSTRGVAPREVCGLFYPDLRLERKEGGNDPTGPTSWWYWLRKSSD